MQSELRYFITLFTGLHHFILGSHTMPTYVSYFHKVSFQCLLLTLIIFFKTKFERRWLVIAWTVQITSILLHCKSVPWLRKPIIFIFGCKIGDQDKSWAPHICCNTCATNLRQWFNRKRKAMPFAVLMVWREPTDHVSNCYCCMKPPVGKGVCKHKKWTLQYPNIPSAIRPAPRGEGLPIPERPDLFSLESEDEEDDGTC